jgi:CheY-like chemotaxis protein/sugar lactone lactonase YvrE
MEKKILIISQEHDFAYALKELLTNEGYAVDIAGDGISGTEYVKKHLVDLVIMDYELPLKNGLEVAEEIRLLHFSLPIIMLSTENNIELAVEAMRVGVRDYLIKPFDNDKLITLIKNIFRHEKFREKMEQRLSTSPATTITTGMRTPIPVVISLSIALILFMFATYFMLLRNIKQTPKWSEYDIDTSYASSICIDPEDETTLWLSDWYNQKIYKYKILRLQKKQLMLKLETNIYLPDIRPSGITVIGSKYMFISDIKRQSIWHIQLAPHFKVVRKYKYPGANPISITYDGHNLITIDSAKEKIYRHANDDMLSIIGDYDLPAGEPTTILYANGYIWTVDGTRALIYQHRLDLSLSVIRTYNLSFLPLSKRGISGIAMDSKNNVWACSEGIRKVFHTTLPEEHKFPPPLLHTRY